MSGVRVTSESSLQSGPSRNASNNATQTQTPPRDQAEGRKAGVTGTCVCGFVAKCGRAVERCVQCEAVYWQRNEQQLRVGGRKRSEWASEGSRVHRYAASRAFPRSPLASTRLSSFGTRPSRPDAGARDMAVCVRSGNLVRQSLECGRAKRVERDPGCGPIKRVERDLPAATVERRDPSP